MSRKGHHGGAWKVAYADFVTAMMALFLVLWLVNQDQRIREAVERAFKQPFSLLPPGSPSLVSTPKPPDTRPMEDQDQPGMKIRGSMVELSTIMRQLQQALQTSADEDAGKTVEVKMVSDGLKISIFDRSRRPIFEPQSADFTPYGDWVLGVLAWPVSHYHNFNIEVEGHTEAGRPPLRESYGNWELSADRANAARRKLIEHGVVNDQVRKVAGYADTQPIEELPPEDEVNRRVTVLLKVRASPTAG